MDYTTSNLCGTEYGTTNTTNYAEMCQVPGDVILAKIVRILQGIQSGKEFGRDVKRRAMTADFNALLNGKATEDSATMLAATGKLLEAQTKALPGLVLQYLLRGFDATRLQSVLIEALDYDVENQPAPEGKIYLTDGVLEAPEGTNFTVTVHDENGMTSVNIPPITSCANIDTLLGQDHPIRNYTTEKVAERKQAAQMQKFEAFRAIRQPVLADALSRLGLSSLDREAAVLGRLRSAGFQEEEDILEASDISYVDPV